MSSTNSTERRQNGEKHELDLLGKPDDLLRFENTIEDDRITIRLTPKSAIEITELKVVYPYEFDERDHILMNGYQSWTVCKEYSSDTTIDRAENMAKVLKHRKTDNTGDRQFTDYEKENRWLHGVSYGYIRQKADFRFFGSLNEAQGFTFFDIDTKKETFTIRKDLQTRLFDTEFTALDVIFLRGTEDEVFDGYFEKLGITSTNAQPMTGYTDLVTNNQGILPTDIFANLPNNNRTYYLVEKEAPAGHEVRQCRRVPIRGRSRGRTRRCRAHR